MIARHRRRFIARNLRPCPYNCSMAVSMGRKITGCFGCESHDPNKCLRTDKFKPAYTKEELAKQFAEELRDPGVLLRDYRDVVVFLWVLGAFDEEKRVDEEVVSRVERKNGEHISRNNEIRPAAGIRDVQADGDSVARGGSNFGAGDSDPEPNYNRAESNYSSTDARLGGGGKLPNRIKQGAK